MILSTFIRNTTIELIEFLQAKKIHVDAVYQRRHKESQPRFRHDYGLIYKDFEIMPDECMILSSLELDIQEISNRKEKYMIFENNASSWNKYLVKSAPIVSLTYNYTPITLLVPHSRISERISFLTIAQAVLDFKFSLAELEVEFIRISVPIPLDSDLPCIIKNPDHILAPDVNFIVFYNFPKAMQALPPSSSRIAKRPIR